MFEKLKPCPSCNGDYLHISPVHLAYAVTCSCGMTGPMMGTQQEAAETWNALPRKLRFSREKPSQNGEWYWYRDIEEGPAIGYLLDGCLSFLGGRYVYIENAPAGEFAGPIHEPEEE